ncbi:hypothetical protein FO519_004543 [Halicephalobus sp. NKZ332]|nr:hypothetical protein FO519_004543 [Halicephalobus sp. NKZ332]
MSASIGSDAASTSQSASTGSVASNIQATSKYRAYATAVDKALKSFESTTEWADLISALGKLCKVLQTNSKNFNDVPKSVIVAKRLSQCLHPALPSGVHLKALETYKQLFSILRKDNQMGKELYLYAIGLFPLMDHCGIKVKSELLSIFEQFILPLGDELKPALPGFIATVLLGLEEGTEFFPRSFSLLEQLMTKVGSSSFYTCLWEAVLHSPAVRLPALNFVNAKFDKKRPIDEQFSVVAGVDHADHMIAALCAVAEDSSGPALMHRHLLDFLCFSFPLDSAHVTQADFVQLLRRCLFIVLRRDMSLTRRLYQWILNKSSDNSTAMIPTNGQEDEKDITFFNTYSLPLIKLSMIEFLKLDVIEVPTLNTVIGSVGGSYEGTKDHQTHFTEVRLCRALQYFLDRPHFGHKILEEILAIFLEHCCVQDLDIIADLSKRCEELDPYFAPDWNSRIESVNQKLSVEEKSRRLDEIKKNFNSLLNNLDAGFLWVYLSDLFISLLESTYKNESDDDDQDLTNEERQKRDFDEEKRKQHIALFPIMVSFCLKVVQLDNHSDIRAVYLPRLLDTILTSVVRYGCDAFGRDNLVALLTNIDDDKKKLTAKSSTARRKQQIEEEKIIEGCLKSAYEVASIVCKWYVITRDRDRTGVLCAISSLLRDFADFPLYCLQDEDLSLFSTNESLVPNLPQWVKALLLVIDVQSWHVGTVDFDVRSRIVDLLIYLYIRSTSLIEQHSALLRRDLFDYSKMVTVKYNANKSTMTVLLKPMLTPVDIRAVDASNVFPNVAAVLWRALSIATEAGNHQVAACLLHRLHSRNANDLSSDVEDIILNDLTVADKEGAGEACKHFRKLWTLTRTSVHEDVYSGIPYKPFNRVTMILLGLIGDETKKNSSLKTVATAWFIDCAKHGDLPRILQMLATMLLNPATARVSIQYMQIQNRITKESVKSMPFDVNTLTLVSANGKQAFHHVCRDVTTLMDNAPNIPVNCASNAAWISDLQRYLYSPNGPESVVGGFANSTNTNPPTPGPVKTHKRTVSDIPQFDDEETESLGDLSMDSTIDPDVIDCVAYLIDAVCEQMEQQEQFDAIYDKVFESSDAAVELPRDDQFIVTGAFKPSDRRSLPASFATSSPKCNVQEEQSKSLLIESSEKEDLTKITDAQANHVNSIPPPQQPTIKRVKCGHRRQDSLQESIFSSGVQELRLFDPAELPKLTAPGDAKQPLLEEAQAHMLLYMEKPDCVDLGRVQGIFKTLSSLMRSNRGGSLGRMIVHCMVFNNTSIIPQTVSGSVCQLVEYMARHYKAIQGEGFWYDANGQQQSDVGKGKHYSFFELFSTVTLYYLRSYFLNSPMAQISEAELTVAWECKIAALDFFTDLLRELISLITETRSREFVNFILSTYRQTKLQRCLISLLVTAVPNPRQLHEKLSVSADIAEFNSSPTKKGEFGDLAFAYHRALLDFSSIVISLEYHMNIGLHVYPEQNLSMNFEKNFVIHKLNYNTTQNRLTLRDPRVLVVELKLFISVIVNALQRLPERHELWLQFLINILPYLEKALPTICIHVVEQLCRNIDTCVNFAYGHVGGTTFDTGSVADESLSMSSGRKKPSNSLPSESYSENYALIVLEALTTIMHYCMLETPSSNTSMMGGVVAAGSLTSSGVTSALTGNTGSPTHSVNSVGAGSISSQSAANSSSNPGAVVSVVNMIPGTKGATEMLGNLFSKVFTSNESSGNMVSSASKFDSRSAADIWRQARDELVKYLPHFLSTVCDIWAVAQKSAIPRLPIGSTEQLKSRVFDLINPIAKRHPNALLTALSSVWVTRASRNIKNDDQLSFVYSDEQLALANLLLNLKVLPFQHVIFTIAECLKEMTRAPGSNKTSTVATGSAEKNTLTEIAILEMLHGCVRLVPADDLRDCWSALNILFSEAPLSSMSPRGVFLEFKILDDFVRIVGSQAIVEDKQISRAVQDACQKLTDAVNIIVGWQLETTTWLKRTLVVRQDTSTSKSGESTPMMETKSLASSLLQNEAGSSVRGSTISLATRETSFASHVGGTSYNSGSQLAMSSSSDKKSSSNLRASVKDTNNNKKDPANSTQALFLLAECLAELIDSICKSEDKEKLLPTLQAVWSNTLPYLRAKSARNARFFLASSQFLASISSFSYMRSVWRKQTLELLFEPSFFKMDIHSLKQWLIVIDNLMTNDKTSFKELLAKIPGPSNSALSSLITSKDAESELRSQALKRLAFVVLSSQMDQYGPQLPDIQERLSDNLRLTQVPIVHAQVFTCYRVLLVRMQPFSFVSIWPSMATELVQVLLQIENQLHLITGDSASVNSVEDLKCSRDDQWMQLYLSACKLLETLCTLPSGYVAQFQTCHWAFVSSLASNSITDQFVPFATRIHKLLSSKYGELRSEDQHIYSASLQNLKTLSSFSDLRPFFHALASQHHTVVHGLTGGGIQECRLHDASMINGTMTLKGAIARLEHGLYVDFAEHLQL